MVSRICFKITQWDKGIGVGSRGNKIGHELSLWGWVTGTLFYCYICLKYSMIKKKKLTRNKHFGKLLFQNKGRGNQDFLCLRCFYVVTIVCNMWPEWVAAFFPVVFPSFQVCWWVGSKLPDKGWGGATYDVPSLDQLASQEGPSTMGQREQSWVWAPALQLTWQVQGRSTANPATWAGFSLGHVRC